MLEIRLNNVYPRVITKFYKINIVCFIPEVGRFLLDFELLLLGLSEITGGAEPVG